MLLRSELLAALGRLARSWARAEAELHDSIWRPAQLQRRSYRRWTIRQRIILSRHCLSARCLWTARNCEQHSRVRPNQLQPADRESRQHDLLLLGRALDRLRHVSLVQITDAQRRKFFSFQKRNNFFLQMNLINVAIVIDEKDIGTISLQCLLATVTMIFYSTDAACSWLWIYMHNRERLHVEHASYFTVYARNYSLGRFINQK